MAVRPARMMTDRLRAMLVRDKMGVKDGFLSALSGDVKRVLGDYFDLSADPAVAVTCNDDGEYEVTVLARASSVRGFRTTGDLPKPEA